MAGKSALPILLGAGALALLLTKKKDKTTSGKKDNGVPPIPESDFIDMSTYELGGGSDEQLVFDAECQAIANKIDFNKHNSWITSRFHNLRDEGMDIPAIALQILKDQSEHCPWDDESQWTPFMKGFHDYLLGGIDEYHRRTSPSAGG